MFERLQKALYSFHLMLFKVYFLWEDLGSPKKDCGKGFNFSYFTCYTGW